MTGGGKAGGPALGHSVSIGACACGDPLCRTVALTIEDEGGAALATVSFGRRGWAEIMRAVDGMLAGLPPERLH